MSARQLFHFSKLSFSGAILSCVVFVVVNPSAQTQTTSMGRQNGADNEYQTGAILWTQSSAEYRALAYQAFSLARLRLDQDLRSHTRIRRSSGAPQSAAVVVDVDETVLDNSRFQAELVLRGLPYTQGSWQAWCERAEAGAIPGAVNFLNYAANRGVHVFYITNRHQREKAGTISNLKALGFPQVSEESVMTRDADAPASKESRRLKVKSRYRIALLLGDNLNDFNDDFSGKSIVDRKAQVDRERTEFGSHYIVVPNPMYGDWENAINGNKPNLTDEQRKAYRTAALKGL